MKTVIAGLITIFVLVQVAYVFDLWPFGKPQNKQENTMTEEHKEYLRSVGIDPDHDPVMR